MSILKTDNIAELFFIKMKHLFRIKSPELSGFTFLEVMVAMAIMAISLVAALGSQSQSVSLAGEARFYTTAPLLAQMKMAETEMVNSEDLVSDSGDFGDDFPDYYWNLMVSNMTYPGADEYLDRLRRIDLIVSWGVNSLHNYSLRLYVLK